MNWQRKVTGRGHLNETSKSDWDSQETDEAVILTTKMGLECPVLSLF